MRRFIERTLMVVATCGALVAWGPAAAEIEETTLSLYWPLGQQSLQWGGLTRFMDAVEQRTDGKVTFNRMCCGTLGGDLEVIEQVRSGAIDFVVSGVPVYSNYHAPINMIGLPGLFENYDQIWKFVQSPLWEELVGGLEDHGLKPIANFNAGFRDVFNSKRPIMTPADLAGLKIKVGPVKSWITLWDVLGANPQPMKVTEQYMAAKTGVVDGAEMSMTNTKTNKMYEVSKYYTVLQIAWTGPLMTMSLDRWNAISPELQNIVVEEARQAAHWTFTDGERQNLEALAWMEDQGYLEVVREPDREAFRAKVEEAYAIYEQEPWYDGELVSKIRDLVSG